MSKVQRSALLESIIWLGQRGFHGKYIADLVGVSKSLVYAACKMHGFSLRDYRNGETHAAHDVVKVCPYSAVKVKHRRTA